MIFTGLTGLTGYSTQLHMCKMSGTTCETCETCNVSNTHQTKPIPYLKEVFNITSFNPSSKFLRHCGASKRSTKRVGISLVRPSGQEIEK